MTLPEVDVDAAPLAEAFARADVDAELVAWDDPAVDWDAALPTVIRSTWNYALDVARFAAWIERVAAGPLLNPRHVVLGNLRKRYLLALEARGVPIVPTTLVEPGGSCDLRIHGDRRIVIKPEVGAGSLGTRAFVASDPAALAHLASLTTRGAALVQPYVDSVDRYGERSLVWIDGELSHAIRKTARFAGDPERIDGPVAIADDERAVAIAALASYPELLYGRIDLVRDAAGTPRVMELELVEPSLFFARQPGSADRFVAGTVAIIATWTPSLVQLR